ncbi:hypothetical protein PUN28_016834 [Cardiocondyla obscurior]|uniref:Uncharacterized protein n=1 Tax=Cardiocondyla obscurior TaxID=286306 RepID=A0AAW2ENY3_9HYME
MYILSRGVRVYIWLSHSLARDFYYPASRRRLPTGRRKPSRTSKIRNRGCLSSGIGNAYYRASSAAPRAHKVEDSANTPTAARLSSKTGGPNKVHLADAANGNLVLYAWRLGRATKIVCTMSRITYYPKTPPWRLSIPVHLATINRPRLKKKKKRNLARALRNSESLKLIFRTGGNPEYYRMNRVAVSNDALTRTRVNPRKVFAIEADTRKQGGSLYIL